MKSLPSNAVLYKKTKVFSDDSIPKGLLKEHQTIAGTWGKIIVLKGSLTYTIVGEPDEILQLSPTFFGIIEPKVFHHVMPSVNTQFLIEFYK